MNGRNLYSYLFIWLCITGLTTSSLAQTITTGSVAPASVCPGGAVTISYTVSGTFAAANTFSAQLSDAAGAFTSPTVIGSVTSTSAGSVNSTIPASTANGSGYRIRIVSSAPVVVGTPSAQALTVNVPSAPATTPAPAYCQNAAAVALIATASAGGTLNWYGTAATGGTASASLSIPNTSQPGTVNYYVSQTIGSCESPRAAIPVTVNAAPGAPTVSSFGVCQNTAATLNATPSANGTLNWYGTAATGGTATATAPIPPTSAVGSTIYYVSQTVNGCESSRAAITVTVNAIPGPPAVTAPGAYCLGTGANALVATASVNGTLNWYGTAASGGTASSVATVPSTSAAGTTTYYVSQAINGCESPRASILVTVIFKPSPPTTTPVIYCIGQSAAALTATGDNPRWYLTQTGGAPLAAAPIPATNAVGSITYYVSQTQTNTCESDRAGLTVTVNSLPTAPNVSDIGLCVNGPSAPLTANGISLKWYDASDNLLGGAPTPNTGTVGTQTFKVTQSSAMGCESSKATINVTIKSRPAPPTATPLAPYCQGASASPLTATGSGLLWYGTNETGGNGVPTATTPSTAAPGTTNYYVSQTINGCESSARFGITVTVNPTPAVPATTPAPIYCQNAPAVALVATGSGALNWYGTAASGGIASATANTPNTSQPGTFNYYVSQTIAGCEGPRATITVIVNPTPIAPGISPVAVCQNTPAIQLTATPLANAILNWYGTNQTGGTPSSTAPTPPTTTPDTTIYYVSQSLNSCEGPRAAITVTIKGIPQAPKVANLRYCLQTQDQPAQTVAPLTASGSELRWFNSDGNPFPNTPTPAISQTGVQTYLVTQTYLACESPKATLTVTVGTTGSPTVAKSLVTYCINDKPVPLEATATTGNSLRWVNPYGAVSTEAPVPSTFNTSIQAGGDPFYVYQVDQNGCYGVRSTIKVLVNALPTLSLIPSATNINLGQRVSLQLNFTSAPPFSYTLTNGLSGVVASRNDTTLSLLLRGSTTYQIVSVKNSCGVGLPGNPATAAITVRIPIITTGALASSTLCVGTSLSVPFTTTGDFNSGNLFRIELVSVADTSKKYTVPTTATASPVTAPLPLTLVSGQYYVHVKADNPEIPIIGSNSLTTLTVRSLPTATLTGSQNVYAGYPGSLTLTFGGDGPWAVTYADTIRSYSVTAAISPFPVEIRPVSSTTYRLLSVTNGCGSGPVSGTAVIKVLPLLGVDDNSLDPLVKTYPVPTTSILTVELDLPLTRDPATLSLTDMNGRPVLQQTTRNKHHELDLSPQPSGLYLLHIKVGDRSTTRKVLKQ